MSENNPSLEVSVDGTDYLIRFGDFNALEAREFRREIGSGLAAAFTDSPDLDTIAGVLWLHRRKTNPKLKFDEVAAGLTYLNFEAGGGGDDQDEPEVDADPET